MTRYNIALLAAAAMVVAGSARATIVDFSDLISTDTVTTFGPLYSEDGLDFNANSTFSDSLGSWGSGETENADPGGATLYHNYVGGLLSVSLTGGGGFFLNALELGDLNNVGSPGRIVFNYVDGSGSHSRNLVIDESTGLQTFNLNLPGVISFSLGQDRPYFQVDNIVYNEAGDGVPEPATWALLMAGFGLAGAALRSRPRTCIAESGDPPAGRGAGPASAS